MSRNKPRVKTAVMTIRVDPNVKVVAEVAAERDHRSLTSLIEVLILNHCEKLGIHIQRKDGISKKNEENRPPSKGKK